MKLSPKEKQALIRIHLGGMESLRTPTYHTASATFASLLKKGLLEGNGPTQIGKELGREYAEQERRNIGKKVGDIHSTYDLVDGERAYPEQGVGYRILENGSPIARLDYLVRNGGKVFAVDDVRGLVYAVSDVDNGRIQHSIQPFDDLPVRRKQPKYGVCIHCNQRIMRVKTKGCERWIDETCMVNCPGEGVNCKPGHSHDPRPE